MCWITLINDVGFRNVFCYAAELSGGEFRFLDAVSEFEEKKNIGRWFIRRSLNHSDDAKKVFDDMGPLMSVRSQARKRRIETSSSSFAEDRVIQETLTFAS